MEAENGTSLIVFETLAIGLQATSVLLNAAILSTLWKKSLFNCPSNKLVFSLCFAHLFLSSISILISVTQSLITSPKSPSGSIRPEAVEDLTSTSVLSLGEPLQYSATSVLLSHVLLYLTLCVATGTSITVALISLERYVTIARPMKYKSIVTRGRCTVMILVCWLFSVLSTLLPILIFGNQTTLHGTIAIPSGGLGLYYAFLLTSVTSLVITIMILCYAKIFKIAKEKCVKVQIGQLTSPVSSISSDWPSSVYYSSHQEVQQDVPHAAQHSLLHYVLMANLEKHSQAQNEPYVLTLQALGHLEQEIVVRTDVPVLHKSCFSKNQAQLPRSGHSSSKSKNSKSKSKNPSSKPLAWTKQPRCRRSWRTFLHQNYNSPNKTISTIILIIGSLFLTQLPIGLVLFGSSYSLFHFTFKILFAFASISSPLLYGFLNRSIRVHLWKFLRLTNRSRARRKAFDLMREKSWDSRKASISSGDSQVFPQVKRQNSIIEVQEASQTSVLPKSSQEETKNPVSNEKSGINIKAEKVAEKCGEKAEGESTDPVVHDQMEDHEGDLEVLSSSFPRKPSQDSGADVSFSEDEEDDAEAELPEDDEESDKGPSCSRRIRIPPRSIGITDIFKESSVVVHAAKSLVDSDSEEDWEDEFDEDEEFERMKDLIRKKFSITGEDEGSSGVEDYLDLELEDHIEV